MFEWDTAKARGNRAKHGVSFAEASTVFEDGNGLDGPDLAHSVVEPRRLRMGTSILGRVLLVACTRRWKSDEEITRIISARPASGKERTRYESGQD